MTITLGDQAMDKMQLKALLPDYRGLEWQDIELPNEVSHWVPQAALSEQAAFESLALLREAGDEPQWVWPQRPIAVLSDLHADADACISSLIASGMVAKTGAMDDDVVLTPEGKEGLIVICGDCFDKGPSNLRLLRVLKNLLDKGAKLKIIAGNHDVRFYAGIKSLDNLTDPLLSHLFLRMAPKGVTFLKEIYDTYLANMPARKRAKYGEILAPAQVRERLYPNADWEERFRHHAVGLLSAKKIRKEIKKIREKQASFEELCIRSGLTLSMAYAAINMWKALFIEADGEFHWFVDKLKLMHGEGSLLFLHAGIDDKMAERVKTKSIKSLNKAFKRSLDGDLFQLYYGPMGNVFRSKYRDGDLAFSQLGANHLLEGGYTTIVHGHVNRHYGQEIVIRKGIVNIECDASLDIKTRQKEGLSGRGAAATVIRPEGCVLGISVDYPHVKAFTL